MSDTAILLDIDGKALGDALVPYLPNKQLDRAIDGCVKVARLYKKHGKPPVFHATKTVYNPPRRRARLARSRAPTPVQNVCSRCGLLFIGPSEKRWSMQGKGEKEAMTATQRAVEEFMMTLLSVGFSEDQVSERAYLYAQAMLHEQEYAGTLISAAVMRRAAEIVKDAWPEAKRRFEREYQVKL